MALREPLLLPALALAAGVALSSAVEFGAGEAAAVSGIMANAGLTPAAPVRADLAGIPRALTLAISS